MSSASFRTRQASLLLTLLLLAPMPVIRARAGAANTTARGPAQPASSNVGADDPREALAEGRRLLLKYQLDRAFTLLRSALELFDEAGDPLGAAATRDALGDLYVLHGQQATAFDYWREAERTFRRQNDTQNANAVLAKVGEQHLLDGDTEQARAAFAAMTFARPGPTAAATGDDAKISPDDKAPGGDAKQSDAGGLAAFASLGSCLLPPGVANPAEPPNEGSAPRTPNGKGRMDLRVTDEAGRPLEGVVAQVQSARANGLYCECWSTTGALGRAVLPELPIAQTVKLVLKAKDLPRQELAVSAEELKEPVRVIVSRSGASLAKTASLSVVGSVAGAASCLASYRALNAFATGELGQARADFSGGRLTTARTRYEGLLKQLALPGLENFKQTTRFRAAALTSLGDIALRERRLEDAGRLYHDAVAGARKSNRLDLVWAAQRGLGRVAWEQSLRAGGAAGAQGARLRRESADAYQSALKAIESIRAGSLQADEARTSLLATTKDVYDEAAAVLTKMALGADGSGAGEAAMEHAPALRGESLELASAAFAITEQGRARSLLDMLGEAQAGITEGVPADLLRRRDAIAARQQEIARLLMGVSLPGEAPPDAISNLEAELDRLNVEYDGLENTVRTSSPRYASLTGARPLGLREVQRRVLDDRTALLLYSLGADESFLWMVTPSAVRIVRLPSRSTVEARAMELRARLIPSKLRRGIVGIDVAGDETRELTLASDAARSAKDSGASSGPAAYAAAAHTLYQTVLHPVAAHLGDLRLVVVADGALNYVPFEALVTNAPADADAGAAADYSSLAYLVRTNEVVYAPSASVIDAVRRQAEETRAGERRSGQGNSGGGDGGRGGPVLVIADPVFSSSDVRVKTEAGAGAANATPIVADETRGLTLLSAVGDVTDTKPTALDKLNIKRLPSTRDEANGIERIASAARAPADIWLDLEASEANLAGRDMRRYRVIHFATHGLLNAERPQFTGLVLSLVGETKADGFLRVGEVFNFRLGSPLVMLSACETGLGRERRGEGVIGLTRAFMYAGAPTVGVSLWSVADQSTALLMGDFYKAFYAKRETRPGAAMREAQLNMIRHPRYGAPYYWAPFVLVGDWL